MIHSDRKQTRLLRLSEPEALNQCGIGSWEAYVGPKGFLELLRAPSGFRV